jgi:hypothetical protein
MLTPVGALNISSGAEDPDKDPNMASWSRQRSKGIGSPFCPEDGFNLSGVA